MAQHILISAMSFVFCDRLLAGRGVGVGGLGRLCRLYVRVGHDAAAVNVVVCVFCHKSEIGRDNRLHGMLTLRPLYMGIISVNVPEARILPLHLVSCKTATPSF